MCNVYISLGGKNILNPVKYMNFYSILAYIL